MRMNRGVLLWTVQACLWAQESVTSASVSGRVLDPSGAVVLGATVRARQTETNVSVATATDSEGRFRLPYLRPGVYEIKVRQSGFAEAVRALAVSAGAAFELPITLAVEESKDSIAVQSDAAMIDAARSQIAATVSLQELGNLPVGGRSFLDLAVLIPGVSPTNTGSNQLFAETSAVPGQGISFGSQRNLSNSFLVDGLSANDDAAGLSGIFFGLDSIGEMQVVTSGGQAELGRALGGYVNLVTKSGTNAARGDLYVYFRNQRLNAANPLSNARLPVTQAQYGASLGGPLTKDRTFYFANFEQRNLNQSGLTTISPANVATVNSRLTAVGYRGPLLTTGVYPNPVHSTTALAKLDHQFARAGLFTMRYSLYDVNSRNSRGAGALNAASASSGLDSRDQTVAASHVLTLSPRTVNELRGQFTLSDFAALPTDTVGPAVSIAGVASFGTLSGSPQGRLNKLYEVTDNLAHQAGGHALRAGINLLYNDTRITFPRSYRGSYAFSSLANFLNGVYNNAGFTQTFGVREVSQTNPNLGFYAQDEWKLNPRLTLNLGARYDLQFLDTIATDRNNLSPRAGLAWTPFLSRRTVVRASFGLFYDRVPLRALANALLSAGNTTDLSQLRQINVSLTPGQAGAPVFPNILTTAVPSLTLVNLTSMDRKLQNAYSKQSSFEVEHQVGAQGTLSVGYQHLRGLRLIAAINQNVSTCVASGNNNGCRPNPVYANNSQYSSAADSRYNGLHVSYLQRPSRWSSYRISYALSKSLNNVGEFFFSGPIDPRNIWLDYGRSDDDQRHRVTFDGSLQTPSDGTSSALAKLARGFQLSGMLQYYSALPFNITSGVTTVQGTAGRPLVNGAFIERNAGIGNNFFAANLRVTRTFAVSERLRAEAVAEAFNAFNHRNNLTRNGNFGTGSYPFSPSPAFGQITSVNDPRVLQFALRLRF